MFSLNNNGSNLRDPLIFSSSQSDGSTPSAVSSRIGLFNPNKKEKDEDVKVQLEIHLKGSERIIGTAFSNGDCFFDALAQELQNTNIVSTNYKKLRLLCNTYAKSDSEKNWIKELIEKDGGCSYQDYLATVQFTAPEMEKFEKDNIFSGLAIWGRPHIEGRIICHALSIKLHVVEIIAVEGKSVLSHQLIDSSGSRTIDENEANETYHDSKIMHLVVYQDTLHFVPLVKPSIIKNEEMPEGSNPISLSDEFLAWKLQAQEYRARYQTCEDFHRTVISSSKSTNSKIYEFNFYRKLSTFALSPTSPDRDCFFHAVGKEGFNRAALIEQLNKSSDDINVRTVFSLEIRQFLYLGYSGGHPDPEEEAACKKLLSSEFKKLLRVLEIEETKLVSLKQSAREQLGEKETSNMGASELLALLQKNKLKLADQFENTYLAVQIADKALHNYCAKISVFKDYVKTYLQEARGYIPFARDFGEKPETTIDIINRLCHLNIQIYLPEKTNSLQLIQGNLPRQGECISIFHDGINHFWGMKRLSTRSPEIKSRKEEITSPLSDTDEITEKNTIETKKKFKENLNSNKMELGNIVNAEMILLEQRREDEVKSKKISKNLDSENITTAKNQNENTDLNIPTDDLNFIKQTFTDIQKQIKKIENHLCTFSDKKSKKSRTQSIKDALITISWRFNEINKKYKYNINNKNIVIGEVFSERNWILLDYLVDMLNACDIELNEHFIDTFIKKVAWIEGDKLSINCELSKICDCLPDLEKIISGKGLKECPFLDKITNVPNNNGKRQSFHLAKLDSSVSPFLDIYLLTKICIYNIDFDKNHSQLKPTIAKYENIILLLRFYEVLGEASQNISYMIRESCSFIPWKTKNSEDKKSLLHDFRSTIHHSREKVELMLRFEPHLFDILVKGALTIQKIAKALTTTINPMELFIEEIPIFVSSTTESASLLSLNEALEEILTTAKMPLKAAEAEVYTLLSFANNNDNDNRLYKILFEKDLFLTMNLPETEQEFQNLEHEFLKIAHSQLDSTAYVAAGYNVAKFEIKLQNIFRSLIGKKLAREDINEVLSAQNNNLSADLLKSGIKNVFSGIEKITGNEFQKKYINQLVFKNNNSMKPNYAKALRELKLIYDQDLSKNAIVELIDLAEKERKENAVKQKQSLIDSNLIIEDIKTYLTISNGEAQTSEKPNEKIPQIKKDKLKKLLFLSSQDVEQLYKLLEKPTAFIVLQKSLKNAKSAESKRKMHAINASVNSEAVVELRNDSAIEDYFNKIPQNEEELDDLLYTTIKEIKDVLLNRKVAFNEDEFDKRIRILNYSDSISKKLKNKYLKCLHPYDATKNDAKLKEIIDAVDDNRTASTEFKEMLMLEKFVDGTDLFENGKEDDFKEIVEKLGYEYSPSFDALYSKAKKRALSYVEIAFITKKIILKDKKQENAIRTGLLHILNNELNAENSKDKFQKLLEKYTQDKSTDLSSEQYIAECLILYEKCISVNKIPKEPLVALINKFKNRINNLASIFDSIIKKNNFPVMVQEKLVIVLEYHLEAIGEIAERIALHPNFIESDKISLSYKYLDLIATCRKLMAHFPLEINQGLIDYISRKLILHSSVRIEEAETNVEISTIIKQITVSRHHTVSIDELSKHRVEIFLAIEGSGFRSDFKIFHKSLGCAVGIQADMGFLIEAVDPNDRNLFNVIELGLRLSKLLNANVKVYTESMLHNNAELKLNSDDVNKIKQMARDLESIILEDKFKKIFNENKWSSTSIRTIGKINVSEYLTRNHIEKILLYIFNESIDVKDLENILDNPDSLEVKIKELFLKYNENPQERSKMFASFLTLVSDLLIKPAVMHYQPVQFSYSPTLKNKDKIDIMPIIKKDLSIGFYPKVYPSRIYDEFSPDKNPFTPGPTWKLWENDNTTAFQIKNLKAIKPHHLTLDSSIIQGQCFRSFCARPTCDKKSRFPKIDKKDFITIEELWNYNNYMYEKYMYEKYMYEKNQYLEQLYYTWLMYNMASGYAILVNEEEDGSLIVNYQTYYVKLTRKELDLLYIKVDKRMVRFQRFEVLIAHILGQINKKESANHINGVSQYITKIFCYQKQYLITLLNPNRKLDPELFSKSSLVEYAFEEVDVKAEQKKTVEFRNKRRTHNKYINDIIESKSKNIVADIKALVLREGERNDGIVDGVLVLLHYSKRIDSMLDEYYFENENQITELYFAQDLRQQEEHAILSEANILPCAVKTKEEFRKYARRNPNVINNPQVKERLLQLLDEFLISLNELGEMFSSDKEPFPTNIDSIFDQGSKDLVNKYMFNISNEKAVISTKGVNNLKAIRYFNKFDLMLGSISNPEIISTLRKIYPDNKESLNDLVFKDFCKNYSDPIQADLFLQTNNGIPMRMVCFASEVEYANSLRKKEKYRKILSNNQSSSIMSIIENILVSVDNKINDEIIQISELYKVPTIDNGILGFSSEIARDLSVIHAKIAGHQYNSVDFVPNLILEDLATRVWGLDIIRKSYSGEIKGTSIFKSDIKDLEGLMNLHGWNNIEKEHYKNENSYQNDNQIISDYYEFRHVYENLSISTAREIEYERIIIEYALDSSKHHKAGRLLESYYLEGDLDVYLSAYKNNNQYQNNLINKILDLRFSKKRIKAVLQDPDELEKICALVEKLSTEPGRNILIKDLLYVLYSKIKISAKDELVRSLGIKPYSPKVGNIEKMRLVKKVKVEDEILRQQYSAQNISANLNCQSNSNDNHHRNAEYELLSCPDMNDIINKIKETHKDIQEKISDEIIKQIIIQAYQRNPKLDKCDFFNIICELCLKEMQISHLSVLQNELFNLTFQPNDVPNLRNSLISSNAENALPGLRYQPVPADGHCLFFAVSLYVGQSQEDLRSVVAAHIESDMEQYRNIIKVLNPHKTPGQYLEDLRTGIEWADNLEIAVLMKILDRPIVVVEPNGKIRNQSDLTGSGEPIFVQYNGHNHYDALILTGERNPKDIFKALQLIEHSPKATPKAYISKNPLRHEGTPEPNLNKLNPVLSFSNSLNPTQHGSSTIVDDCIEATYTARQGEPQAKSSSPRQR